jgi:hypothetical protein
VRLFRIYTRETFIENVLGHVVRFRPGIAQVMFEPAPDSASFIGFGVEFIDGFQHCSDCGTDVLDYTSDSCVRYEFTQPLLGQEPFRLRSEIEHRIVNGAESGGYTAPAFNVAALVNAHPLHAHPSMFGRWFSCYGTDAKLRCLHCDAMHRNRSFTIHERPLAGIVRTAHDLQKDIETEYENRQTFTAKTKE